MIYGFLSDSTGGKLLEYFVHVPVTTLQWIMFAAAFAITLPQGILLFRDAQRRGRFPWLWGLWGVLSFPLPTIFYYFIIIRPEKKKKQIL